MGVHAAVVRSGDRDRSGHAKSPRFRGACPVYQGRMRAPSPGAADGCASPDPAVPRERPSGDRHDRCMRGVRERRRARAGTTLAALAALAVGAASAALPAQAAAAPDDTRRTSVVLPPDHGGDWLWPLAGPSRLAARYLAPAHDYAAGHRGIDIRSLGGVAVRAPDDGVAVYAGRVADRGVLTIDHGGGIVSTLEPVVALVAPGAAVRRGDAVALLDAGGHAELGTLHVGARIDGEYVDPLTLLGDPPHAVLLPLRGR